MRLGVDGPTPISGGEANQVQVVVGRELCLFLQIDASRIPAKQRGSFIALAVRRAAPFADPQHDVAWSGAHAAVWYWSRARVLELLGPQSLRIAGFVPESHYTGHVPDGDGALLFALAQGYEGRAWKQGRLVADRWWRALPEEAEWTGFLRGAGLPVATVPAAVNAPIAERPWAAQRQRARLALDDAGTWLRRAAVSAAALGCLATGFEVGAGLRGLTDVHATGKALEQLDAPLTRILEARAEAEQGAEELRQLMGLRAPRSQVALLAEVRRVMPSQDWRIVQWHQTAIDRLEVIFAMANADATAVVSAWENSSMFTEVSSSVDAAGGRVTIQARVVSPGAPSAAPAQAEGTGLAQ